MDDHEMPDVKIFKFSPDINDEDFALKVAKIKELRAEGIIIRIEVLPRGDISSDDLVAAGHIMRKVQSALGEDTQRLYSSWNVSANILPK